MQSLKRQVWEVVYRLFKGKFLRFMAGPSGLCQIVKGTEERGKCLTGDSMFYFSVV